MQQPQFCGNTHHRAQVLKSKAVTPEGDEENSWQPNPKQAHDLQATQPPFSLFYMCEESQQANHDWRNYGISTSRPKGWALGSHWDIGSPTPPPSLEADLVSKQIKTHTQCPQFHHQERKIPRLKPVVYTADLSWMLLPMPVHSSLPPPELSLTDLTRGEDQPVHSTLWQGSLSSNSRH